MKTIIGLALLAAVFFQTPSHSCTSFSFMSGNECIVGKNYDWDIGYGLVIVNKRNVGKFSTAEFAQLEPGFRPVRWTSKYGSVTFNQYGREFPSGGINEAGLVVELLWLDETIYPSPDQRPVLGVLEWIQFQLDRSKTIKEVIANAKRVRIVSSVNLHYLVCEQSGACATIEFLNGSLVTHSRATLPLTLLTNDTYDNSLQHLNQYVGFGGNLPIPQGNSSLDRFVRGASLMQQVSVSNTSSVNDAFSILNSVAEGTYTKWRIVYETKARFVRFKSLASKSIKLIDLNQLDFSCSTPVKVIDVNKKLSGDITAKLVNYQIQLNKNLVIKSFRNTPFLADLPDAILESAYLHPEKTVCKDN